LHDSGSRAEIPSAGEAEHVVAVEPSAAEPIVPAAAEAQATDLVVVETPVYVSSADGALWCCEILSGVMQHRKSFESLHAAEPELDTILHPLCIVISQDCDLEQDFRARQDGKVASLPSVLLCEASSATELKGNVPAGKDIWKRIIQNKDERYQFLQAVAAVQDAMNEGLPELGIDFRRYFSVPTDELYEQFNLGTRRRCRLVSPYKEHFMNRFAHFVARVGLPSDHFSE
jgi:hypothetical protein